MFYRSIAYGILGLALYLGGVNIFWAVIIVAVIAHIVYRIQHGTWLFDDVDY